MGHPRCAGVPHEIFAWKAAIWKGGPGEFAHQPRSRRLAPIAQAEGPAESLDPADLIRLAGRALPPRTKEIAKRHERAEMSPRWRLPLADVILVGMTAVSDSQEPAYCQDGEQSTSHVAYSLLVPTLRVGTSSRSSAASLPAVWSRAAQRRSEAPTRSVGARVISCSANSHQRTPASDRRSAAASARPSRGLHLPS